MRAATKKTLLILFLALSLPALADAATLENASLQWGGDEVTTVNPGNPMAASLYVTLSGATSVDTVAIDYESLNPLSQSPKTFKAHECVSSGDSLICPFSNLVIQPATENPAVNITVTSHDGAEETFTHAFSFALDDTQPEVTFLGTDTCHEGTCYAQSGYTPVRIEMEDSVATFHRKWVAFSLDGTPSKVSMCEDMTCTGASTKECEDGRRVRLAIISYSGSKQSQDDAGNSLTGITETEVICDAEPPEFASDVSVSSSGALTRAEGRDRPFVAMGDTVTITVNVTERTSPTLTLVADASDLGGEEAEGTCSREDETDTWTCTVSVQATPSDLGTYDIPLRVRDLAGNTASKRDLEVDVVERQTGPADNWDMRDPTSQVANRGFLEFTPKRLFVPLALEPKDSGKQLVLDAEMTGTCVPLEKHSEEDVTYGRNGDLSFRVASVAGNNILLRGELHAGTHYYELDYLKYNCSFNVQTLRGDYLSTTEHETFTMTFKLHDSDTIGQKVMEEVEVELNDTVKRLGWVSGTRKTLSGLSAACQIPGVLKGAGGALNSVAAMLDPTPAKAASDATNEGGRILGLTSEQMRPITSVCKVLTCNLNFFEDKVLGGADLSETKIGEGFAKANL
ncbi:hypothetical protein KY327_03785, partial [Candidatus Woesearchaeota archaeon]|nr:hypothetical protein [Candidatus Woesearchaeota archaeon]